MKRWVDCDIFFFRAWNPVSVRICKKKGLGKMEKVLITLIQDVLEKRLIYVDYLMYHLLLYENPDDLTTFLITALKAI